MEFPGENRYIFLGKEMFGFETQSEIVSWQKTGNNGKFHGNNGSASGSTSCYDKIWVQVDYAKLTVDILTRQPQTIAPLQSGEIW